MEEPWMISINEIVQRQVDYICWWKIQFENITGFQSLVREVSTKVTKQYNDCVVSALDPLFEFNIGYIDLNDNSLNIITTPWAYFRWRVDEIGISLKYDVRKVKEIPIEGIDQKMKLDIGPIESFCSFYRALQFLGSVISNTNPEDYFSFEEPWEGYSLYLLSHQNIILTPHLVWRTVRWSWEEELVDIEIATFTSFVDSNGRRWIDGSECRDWWRW